jgi:hypothetical protein
LVAPRAGILADPPLTGGQWCTLVRQGRVIVRTAPALALLGALFAGGCGGDEDIDSKPRAKPEQVKVITRISITPTPGAEVIATGEVLEGSSLGDSPFCVGGTIQDSHGSTDPEVWLIARTITCPDGEVRMDVRPDIPEGLSQTGSWKIVSGTGAFDGWRGSGEMEVAYDPNPEEPAGETYTGTVTP